MHTACSVPKATNTHSEYVTLIDLPTASMVAQTHLNVTLYVHCLSCSQFLHLIQNDSVTLWFSYYTSWNNLFSFFQDDVVFPEVIGET